MANEMRSMVRLIPLWIVLVALLALTFFSLAHLASSVVKTTSPAPEMGLAKTDPYGAGAGMGYNGGYNNYCLTMPVYPTLSSTMMPGTVMTKEDKDAMAKYEQEMKRYNDEYTAACKAEQEKQEKAKNKGLNSAWFGAIAVYTILSLFGIFATALALLIIRRSEIEG